MCNTKFFICNTCGNLVSLLNEGGGTLVCCGKEMQELVPNTVDAAVEKHVPVIEVEGNKVTVKIGSVTHPMAEEHYIEWIYLETKEGVQRKCLKPGDEPKAVFVLNEGDKVVSAYEHCNLHGLWKKEA
ncbi:MAG TPA: desulfoferrodoxin [Clostridiales bacterium]|nr:desulfoferrodoxin [Clostridiales bacterium]